MAIIVGKFTFELHSAPGALGTKIWKGELPLMRPEQSLLSEYSKPEQDLLQSEGARFDEEWQAWWLSGDASRDPNGVKTRRERAEELVARLASV